MIRHDADAGTVTVQNNALRAVISYGRGAVFREFSNILSRRTTNADRDMFVLNIRGRDLASGDFDVTSVRTARDEVLELVTVYMEHPGEDLKVRVHLINDNDKTITVLFQVWDGYKLGVPSAVTMHIPLLANLEAGGASEDRYYPSGIAPTKKGADAMIPMTEGFCGSDILLPLVVCDAEEKFGFSVQFPTMSDLNDAGATQNVNKQLASISNERELACHRLGINPDPSFNDTVELRISGISGGWAEAFSDCRDAWQSLYDFSEYEREDLRWFSRGAVHNFVFLYGREGFDHEKQEIDVDGLLAAGDEFGGYDTVTIWNQYPRLGVDARTQWDFYDDFPGGRAALREAVKKFHDRGVRVFLPYIPWDRGGGETTEGMGDELARIATDTDADGFQLDTMRDLPYSYRKKLDAVRPGLVLTAQHHPLKKRPVEFITTSWDEFWRADPMPEADVFRFMCPHHISPAISRWLRTEDKTVLIRRCEFGASPIVVWQDIFGRWMPYSAEQKERIKTWKRTYLKYREIYQGSRPIPLVPTRTGGVYCNLFTGDAAGGRIYSFYNDNDEDCVVKNFSVSGEKIDNAKIVLGDGEASPEGGILTVGMAAHEVVHVLVTGQPAH
ncbi:MAG: hypothetical protein LBQ56_03620 [Synergistaceae bacterium]|nr:hypothetical protein [Synergistaceae bacterium]